MVDLILAAGVFLGILFMVFGYTLRKEVKAFDPLQTARETGAPFGQSAKQAPARPKRLDQAKAWATEVGRDLTWLPQPINLEQRLAWAGKLGQVTPEQLRGEQILYMLVMLVLGFVIGIYRQSNSLAVALAIAAGLIGLYLPIYVLDQEGKKRQKEITITLPDAVDLISTSVAAGLGIDRAITYAAQNISGPLATELTTFLQEMQLGRPRDDAYQQLIWRNNSDEIQTIVGALLQGQSLGVPVTETLEAQAETMRERRLQRAKTAGAEAAPRITCVMTGCLMPSIFLIFLAVVGFAVSKNFQTVIDALSGGG